MLKYALATISALVVYILGSILQYGVSPGRAYQTVFWCGAFANALVLLIVTGQYRSVKVVASVCAISAAVAAVLVWVTPFFTGEWRGVIALWTPAAMYVGGVVILERWAK